MAIWQTAGKVRMTPKGVYNSSTAYEILDIVSNADQTISYIAKQAVPAGTALTNTTYWTVIADVTEALENADAAISYIGDSYSSSSTYAVGDYVIHDGGLYRCKTAISTAEAWTAAHWQQVSVTDEFFNFSDDVVKVSNTQPTSVFNRVWIDSETESEEVPTYEEFQELESDVADLKSAIVAGQENKLQYFLTNGEYINKDNGAFTPYSGWARTNRIPVKNYRSIIVKSSVQSYYNVWYKEDGTRYSDFAVTTTETKLNVPKLAAYVGFSNTSEGMQNLEVSVETIDHVSIVDLAKTADDTSQGYVPMALTEKGYIANGVFAYDANWCRTGYVYVGNALRIAIETQSGNQYNAFYDENKTLIRPFTTVTGTNIIDLTDDIQYLALSNSSDIMRAETVRVLEYRRPEYNYTAGDNIYLYPDIPETVYSRDEGVTYSVRDGIITVNGAVTQATFRLDFPMVTLNGYNIFNVEILSGSYTGTVYLLLLPTSSSAYITNPTGHITRLDNFNNESHGIGISAPVGATFSNLKFRIWMIPGLLNRPYDRPHYYLPAKNAVGLSAGEFNTPQYPRFQDGTLYNIFGNQFSAFADNKLSRTKDSIKFGLMADMHYTDNEDFYKRIYRRISTENIDFCIMTGDIIDSGYYRTPDLLVEQMEQYEESIKYLGAPNFAFAGNHDDDVSSFAHHGVIDCGNVRFIYFWADYNGSTAGGRLNASELTWIENQLKSSHAKFNILMCHYAVSTDSGFGWYISDAESREAIEDLAEEYDVKLYLNGHEHDHNISVGTAGVMTDINLPNGKYAYAICEISANGIFTATFYDSATDSVLKTLTVDLTD